MDTMNMTMVAGFFLASAVCGVNALIEWRLGRLLVLQRRAHFLRMVVFAVSATMFAALGVEWLRFWSA